MRRGTSIFQKRLSRHFSTGPVFQKSRISANSLAPPIKGLRLP
jgi:hypothetical protein